MALQVWSPSSSSHGFTSKTKYRYDVFLSFRGEDTRTNFTVPLYNALQRKGINAFIDDKRLGKGEEISPTLLKAIEKSRISIIAFSKNYATSTWCLEELAHIILCMKQRKQMVMPIFFKVDPLDVQYQRNSFQEAMADLENRFINDAKKVQKWRSALSEAASLSSAWIFEHGCDQPRFIERIVEDAFVMLPPKRFHNTDYMVGLEPHIEEVMSLLDKSDDRVCMLGIHGTGGIGKTTLAKAVHNAIFYQFDGSCFLFDIREESNKYQGIVHLQQSLLSEVLDEKITFVSIDEGISRIKHRLSHKKVLLVLDDVDEVEQLEKLAGGCHWFGNGSKVIITTRNKQLLNAHNVQKTYEMKELNKHDSFELFCWHAFQTSQPPKGYKDMSNYIVSHVQGLPLALRLIGSNLAHKSIEEWKSTLKQYDRIPEKTINEVLKISYDCLQDDAKHIFLDIACFFKKEKLEFVEEILAACGYGARFYIEVLVEKSLITIGDDNGRLYMHDLIQHMGKEIVRQEAPSSPGKRSRLWYYKDVLKVLQESSGSNNIEGIRLDPPQQEDVNWNGLAFKKMNDLKILIVRNVEFSTSPKYLPNSLRLLDWEGYPSMTLPPDFSPTKLVYFKLYKSLFSLTGPFKKFEHVTHMDFSHCEFITEVPDMTQFQSLRKLLFQGCQSLIRVHDSVGTLSRLVILDVSECTNLVSFPLEINMPSLEELNLSECKSLAYFPHIVGKMDSLTDIYVSETAIKERPPSIGNLPRLETLLIRSCRSLREIPNSLLMLQNLSTFDLGGIQPHGRESLKRLMQGSQPAISYTNIEYLDLENCGLLDEDLYLILNCFQKVRELNLSRNNFVSLPMCIKECVNLRKFDVTNCKMLRDIPHLPSKLQDIRAENCTSLTTESLGNLWSQVKNCFCLGISAPATTFPDWFDHCCKGSTLSFRVRGKNFPRTVIAIQCRKSNTKKRHFFQVFMRINGHNKAWIQSDAPDYASEQGRVFVFFGKQGHVFLFDLLKDFREQEVKGLNKFMDLDWNDVDILITCFPHHISKVKCGVYVDKQEMNMEDVQFISPLLLSSRTSSLKRRAIGYPPNQPPKKLIRKFKANDDEGKLINTKKRTRRTRQYPHFNSGYRRKIIFPLGKHLWRFLYY